MSFVRYVFSALKAERTRDSNSYPMRRSCMFFSPGRASFARMKFTAVRRFKDEISRHAVANRATKRK